MNFGKSLKEVRENRGLSQEALATEINRRVKKSKNRKEKKSIKRNTISNYENNNSSPDIYTLKAIGEILQVSLDALLDTEKIDVKSLTVEDSSQAYLKAMGKKVKEIEKVNNDPNSDLAELRECLNVSTDINKELIEKNEELYEKNRKAIKFINRELDSE